MASSASSNPVVQFRSVTRRFGRSLAVDALDFAVHRGEFFSFLGPSGCGKTTTLRLLAGFETPDEGEIFLEGRPAAHSRPYERNVGMVFQNYALFPHLTVGRNVAFGLEQRNTPREEIGGRVARALTLVRLEPDVFAGRLPSQLSGGQRQRVALARALVLEPPILLLDEPLGAIDLKLRKQMQFELKALNKSLGITFIYVTHDQEEALTMSDRIAVMSAGRIEQLGTPAEIYESPRTAFVAGFIGDSNFFGGRVSGGAGEGMARVQTDEGWTLAIPAQGGLREGTDARIAVRPEWMDLFPPDAVPTGENRVDGEVREIFYRGETMHVVVTPRVGQDVTVAVRNEGQLTRPLGWRIGDAVAVAWRPEDCQVLEAD